MNSILPALVATILLITPAFAGMPALTEQPSAPTIDACRTWASQQGEETQDMWGVQQNGDYSRDVGVMRLSLTCLGDPKPAIVGFGSSSGFDQNYCRRHSKDKICQQYR